MKKNDLYLILALLVLGLAGIGGMRLYRAASVKNGPFVRITVQGHEYGTYYLKEDQTVSINDTNVLEIRDGKASMIEARCPDHLCMRMGPISQELELIVCLPNEVIVEGFAGN